MNAKIRTEGMDHSKIMWIEHYLTDVYGPRPIGSPNHVAAAELGGEDDDELGNEERASRAVHVARRRLAAGTRRPASSRRRCKANLKFEAVPWSPSTKGTVSGEVVSIVAPETPTEAELDGVSRELAPKVKGGIVMVGAPPTCR